jgi:hypothetical protein
MSKEPLNVDTICALMNCSRQNVVAFIKAGRLLATQDKEMPRGKQTPYEIEPRALKEFFEHQAEGARNKAAHWDSLKGKIGA